MGHALHGLAACNMVNDWDECVRLLNESLRAFEIANNSVQAALVQNTMTATYRFLGRQEEAEALYQHSFEVLDAINDVRLAMPLRALADVASKNRDYGRAKEFLLRARSIAEKTGNQRGLLAVLLNLGDLEYGLDNIGVARNYYEQALVAARIHGKSMMPVDSLGRVAVRQGRITQAIQNFSRALTNSVNQDFQMIVLLHCVELFIATERLDLAEALSTLVFHHPATARSTFDQLETLLKQHPEVKVDRSSDHELNQLLADIDSYLPQIAEVLRLPDTFFTTLLAAFKQYSSSALSEINAQ